MILEPNNLISEATNSTISPSREQSVVLNSSIDSVSDLDLYKFQLNSGQGITLNIDTVDADNNTANFDSYLRVFDGDGQELAVNDDFSLDSEEFSLDSYIGFIANQTGEYYVGVSSAANNSYNPLNGEGVNQFQDNFVPGDYDLTLDIVEVIPDEDTDNTISEAIVTELGTSKIKSQVFSEEVTTESDVDLYKFQLDSGEGIKLKVNAKSNDSNLDSYLRIFDAEGKELTFNDNSDRSEGITTDSTIDFAPENPGEYYVGVSSAGNFDYDGVNGDTNLNFSPNKGFSTGNYELQLDVIPVVADEDPDNTIAEAVDSGVTSSGTRNAIFQGEVDPEVDVDIYKFQLGEGDGVKLKINAQELDSELDSFLRLFDSEGNELTFDDNNDANVTGYFSKDSAIAFIPDTPGEYFVGVGASGNFDYDPIIGRNNFSPDENPSPFTTIGNYELGIDILEVVADQDPDNTIAEAIASGVSSTGATSAVLTEEVTTESDVDIYKFQLDQGEGITLDIDAAGQDSDLDSLLRLFDSEGNELAVDNDDDNNVEGDSNVDSLLNFVADTSGEYFIGVSSDGNSNYDLVTGSNNFTPTTGFTAGQYELGFTIASVVADQDPDNTIPEAINTGVSSSGQQSITINDAINLESDVDIYKFQLDQGSTVTLDIDAAILNTGLDSVLHLFDGEGKEITNNDDGATSGEGSSTDSLIEFTAPETGEYYLGVSSFANFNYDPLNGSTNFSNDIGSSTGNYELVIDINK